MEANLSSLSKRKERKIWFGIFCEVESALPSLTTESTHKVGIKNSALGNGQCFQLMDQRLDFVGLLKNSLEA